MLQMLYTTHI